jgi:phosphoribosyl 1,2-cyclic phosphodiesterase
MSQQHNKEEEAKSVCASVASPSVLTHHSHGMNASLVSAPAGLRMIALLAFAF